MTQEYSRQSLDAPATELAFAPKHEAPAVGISAALIYALLAQRLSTFYEHDYWMTQTQAAALCAKWLTRSKQVMPLAERKHLADVSDALAAQIKDSLSREAGLHTAHELMESLDARYISEIGSSIMDECVRLVKSAGIT